jgi:hypothetical protein
MYSQFDDDLEENATNENSRENIMRKNLAGEIRVNTSYAISSRSIGDYDKGELSRVLPGGETHTAFVVGIPPV